MFLMIMYITILSGCTTWRIPASVSDAQPPVFPDYKDITVPSNIAPLNFMMEDVAHVQVVVYHDGKEHLRVSGRDGVVTFPQKKWQNLLKLVAGGTLHFEVSAWSDEFQDGVKYSCFTVNVAQEAIDPWIAYRLIEPGYRGWRQIGLFQRNLSNFEESAIVTNAVDNETCLNCHHFPSYSSESMMFHARGKNGGTILYKDGKLSMIKFNEIGPKKNTTYPAWHPSGRLIAFSSNTTRQTFYLHGQKPLEVYDHASDLLVYDTETGEVITDSRFMTAETLETFPAWSPGGDYLYYAAADANELPDQLEQMHYHLLRVQYDASNNTFGQIDTLYDAASRGGSVSYPRVSPDGRYLLYTWSEYGTFPVWHQEADLKMIDLETSEEIEVSVWNAPDQADSYHSWSSDGRWTVLGSRRDDGRYTRLYIAYFDTEGKAHKPFLLPQKDPRFNIWRLKSYNVPEFIDGEVDLPESVVKLLAPEK